MELRWYQREACEAVWSHLCGQAGNPVVVLPTGAGKSLVIAELCRAAVQQFKGRVMILAHRKELLEQNADKVKALLPFGVSVGLYSAGLRRFATDDDVILGGIQSVYKKAELFGARHLVLIDEVHLVPNDGEGMYRTFLDELRGINPKLRMVGLTATPFRTDAGSLCRADALFQRICYEAKIPRLIADGFLSPITNRPADAAIDTSGIKIRGGEFVPGEMERAFDQTGKVEAACREILAKTADRRSVLIFCAGLNHAQHVANTIERLTGGPCGLVTGKTLDLERSATLSAFRRRELRYLCNVDVLTTGYDAPCIDAIAVLRATQSAGLFAQICGRGFRLFAGKENCLILDFGENIKRHGPLDAANYGQRGGMRRGDGEGEGEAPTKKCPNCESESHASATECLECGFKFPQRDLKHQTTAEAQAPILVKPQKWIVEEVRMSRHRKRKAEPDTPNTLRVDYICLPADASGGNLERETISEWVCLEHPTGYALRKALHWWAKRCKVHDVTIDDAIDLFRRGAVATPRSIVTTKDDRFHRITEYELDELPTEWLDEAADLDADPWIEQSEEVPF